MAILLWKCSWRWLWQSKAKVTKNRKKFFLLYEQHVTHLVFFLFFFCMAVITRTPRVPSLMRTRRRRWSTGSFRFPKERNRRSWLLRVIWPLPPPNRPSQRATACCCLSWPAWIHSKMPNQIHVFGTSLSRKKENHRNCLGLGVHLDDLLLRFRSRSKASTSLCVSDISCAAAATRTSFSTSSRDRWGLCAAHTKTSWPEVSCAVVVLLNSFLFVS